MRISEMMRQASQYRVAEADPRKELAALGKLLGPLKSKGWKLDPSGSSQSDWVEISAKYPLKGNKHALVFLSLRAYQSGSAWSALLTGAWPEDWSVSGVRTTPSNKGWGLMSKGLIDLEPIRYEWPEDKKNAIRDLKKMVATLAKATP